MTVIDLVHSATPTSSKGWDTRRMRKLIKAVTDTLALINIKKDKFIGLDYSICPRGASYVLAIHFDNTWTESEIQLFFRLVSQIKYFNYVQYAARPLDNHAQSDTMPPCQEETEQQPRQPATLQT